MHCACAEEHLEAVEVLIGLGANVDAQDNDSNTPLHVDTRSRHTGIAQLLLKARANTEITDAVNRIISRRCGQFGRKKKRYKQRRTNLIIHIYFVFLYFVM